MSIRKTIAILLAALLLGGAALGEATMEDLRAIRKSAEDAIAEIELPTPSPEPTATPEATPEPTPTPLYELLQQGSKGENVRRLQSQLKALGYLDGGIDGNFGPRTREAVEAFQAVRGLPINGVADQQTQAMLFGIEAPHTLEYETLKYDKFYADPMAFMGVPVTFTGTVMQVLTDDTYSDSQGIYTAMRVATRKHAYDVIYVTLFRPADSRPIAEGETVEVWGTFSGMKSYRTVSGGTAFVLWVEAERVY